MSLWSASVLTKVKTFIEKPQLEFAQVFVESDEFYWNSGIFLWNVNTILKAFDTYMPELRETFKGDEDELEALPNISIDYAIMEKADNVYVQLCNFGCSFLGRRIQVKVRVWDVVRTPLTEVLLIELDLLGPESISKSVMLPTRKFLALWVLTV